MNRLESGGMNKKSKYQFLNHRCNLTPPNDVTKVSAAGRQKWIKISEVFTEESCFELSLANSMRGKASESM